MKLKKPAKDHRGEWDLVLDNEGAMVAALKLHPAHAEWGAFVEILWPFPIWDRNAGTFEWRRPGLLSGNALEFFAMLGVDTAPLEKLQAEKLMEEKAANAHSG